MAQKSQNNPGTNTTVRDFSFVVPARQEWFDTGIDLQPGELVYVSGGVFFCGATTSDRQSLPLPSAQVGALLAKVELGAKPVSAILGAELPVTVPGRLYLGVNGANCTGKLPAKVHVERAPNKTH